MVTVLLKHGAAIEARSSGSGPYSDTTALGFCASPAWSRYDPCDESRVGRLPPANQALSPESALLKHGKASLERVGKAGESALHVFGRSYLVVEVPHSATDGCP